MTEFEYLSVLISIVLGLGISHLLAGVAQLVRFRSAVHFYLPVLLWIGMLFIVHVQVWWAIFELRDVAEWTFFAFVLVLGIPTLIYLLTFLLLPDFDREERVDLQASYFENRTWFFALLALVPLVSLAQEYVLSGFIRLDADPAFRLGFLAMALLGLFTARERVHQLLAPLALLLVVAYVVLLFIQLG